MFEKNAKTRRQYHPGRAARRGRFRHTHLYTNCHGHHRMGKRGRACCPSTPCSACSQLLLHSFSLNKVVTLDIETLTQSPTPPHMSFNLGTSASAQPTQVGDACADGAALCPSALEETLSRLSPQFCSAVFGLRSAISMCASMAARLQLLGARFSVLSAPRCRAFRVYEVSIAHEERLRAICGGGIGLLVLRMIVTGGVSGRDVKKLTMSVVRRVAAVHAAATLEGALLADMLFWGRPDLPIDHKRAFELASVGAGMGCAHSKGVIGYCYAYGLGVAEHRGKGLELAKESAAAGSCMGQFLVGKCYHAEWGVEQDFAESLRFYRLAAEQGHAVAQLNLGIMFEGGLGVAQDYAEALRFYHLAAAQGYANGQFNLARMFHLGKGVAPDYVEAVRIYSLAVAQGHANSQSAMGNIYEEGRGVAQDSAEAVRFWRLAAAQGFARAQCNLGHMFHRGRGVDEDSEEALRLYRLSAAQGLAEAQERLGFMLETSQGVAQDRAEAIRWYRLAAAHGDAYATAALVRLGV